VKRNTTLAAVAVCASAVVGLAALGTPATADPIGAPAQRVLVLQGSDTTQDVMNGFADAITAPNATTYRAAGLLHDATAVGATTINTSLLPAVGDVLSIDSGANAETATVTSLGTLASANTAVAPATNAVNFNVVNVTALTKAHAVNAIVDGAFVPAGTKVLASYNAVGGAFTSKANPNCQYIANNGGTTGTAYTGTTQNGSAQAGTNPNSGFLAGGRANGSGNGASSMGDSFSTASALWGCTDVARASSKRSNVLNLGAGNAVNIPFAIDGVDFAVTTTSNYPRKLSFDQLNQIYRCTYPNMIPAAPALAAGSTVYTVSAATGQQYATLPQAGSGTRAFVIGALNITEGTTAVSGTTGAACITDKTPTGATLEEHNLTTLDDNGIGVTSIAQSIAQRAQAITGVLDKQGRTVLVALDNTAASNGGVAHNNGKLNYAVAMTSQFGGGTGNTAGALQMWRDVFNVVPLARLADPNIQAAFVGATSAVCADATGVLGTYGFAPNPNCGITTNVG
jgi:hypothetical protein